MSKLVHLYDETSGVYCGDYVAQESQLEPGEYITPIYSTDVPVLPEVEGKTRNFVNGEWVYVDLPPPPQIPVLTGNALIQSQIDDIERQYTTTIQMQVATGDTAAISMVSGWLSKIQNLKSQLT